MFTATCFTAGNLVGIDLRISGLLGVGVVSNAGRFSEGKSSGRRQWPCELMTCLLYTLVLLFRSNDLCPI